MGINKVVSEIDKFLKRWGLGKVDSVNDIDYEVVYAGPLYYLLFYDVYEPETSKISKEAWEMIFEHTEIITEYIQMEYGVKNLKELAMAMWNDIFDNPDYSYWDPLEYDCWEDYINIYPARVFETEKEELAYMKFDTYEEYRYYKDAGFECFAKDKEKEILSKWNKIVKEAKQYSYATAGWDEIEDIKDYVKKEFNEIFNRNGMRYMCCEDSLLIVKLNNV